MISCISAGEDTIANQTLALEIIQNQKDFAGLVSTLGRYAGNLWMIFVHVEFRANPQPNRLNTGNAYRRPVFLFWTEGPVVPLSI